MKEYFIAIAAVATFGITFSLITKSQPTSKDTDHLQSLFSPPYNIDNNRSEGLGLTQVNSYLSKERVPLLQNHQYDLVTSYNNLSGENQTVMSVMFLYIEYNEFKKPKLSSGLF